MRGINSRIERLTPAASNTRVQILLLAILLALGLIVLRLFDWQILQNQTLSIIAKSQQQISKSVAARRGGIYSSDNFPLAASRQTWLLWATIPELEDISKTAHELSIIIASYPQDLLIDTPDEPEGGLEDGQEGVAATREELVKEEEARLLHQMTKKDIVWIALKNRITREQKEKIENLAIKGLGFDPQEDRDYPEASLAAHILGFLGRDLSGESKGYFGLEGYYDLTLSGLTGEKAWEKDASGKPIILGTSKAIEALDGIDLKTNINRSLQFILEKHLREAREKYQAGKTTAVIMRPDGAVLAMAAVPSYEPARYFRYPSDRFVDPVIGESFEPGSIFKVLVMASALDMEVVEPDTRCDNCNGPRQIAEYTIGSGTNKYYPDTTMREVIKHSDNVGMIWVAEKMGKESLFEYLTKFGIGTHTGIDLQGESAQPLRKLKDWTVVDLATAGFGQGVAVTPIQMVRAVAAIANGGSLPKPFVVKQVVGESWEKDVKPEYMERVISKRAAREITEMMVAAVDSRSDMWGKPQGFRIAGKTGTAQVPVAGHYDDEKTIHSFIGFAPAEDAEYVMIVTLRDPKGWEYASQTAAPVWFGITRDIIPVLGVQPD